MLKVPLFPYSVRNFLMCRCRQEVAGLEDSLEVCSQRSTGEWVGLGFKDRTEMAVLPRSQLLSLGSSL